jgi:hypothetical protein
MRSGAAAKLKAEKITMQRLRVERLDKGSKAADERGMVSPWRGSMVGTSRALSSLLFV